MANLFLDANILLDFYRFGTDDLVEIAKLSALIEDGEVVLFTNAHLRNETQRMRERVLSDSFSELKAAKQKIRTPNYCGQFLELEKLQVALKVANAAHGELVSAVQEKINSNQLDSDLLILAMFAKSTDLEITSQIMDAARIRQELGNPPGKQGSIGDGVHWETLLSNDNVRHIDIVSRDADFESELDIGEIKPFLSNEWKEKKYQPSRVTLFKSLSSYFKKRYPKIKLSNETQKAELIEELRNSSNFATTHAVIESLAAYDYFTRNQMYKLFEILCENTQVGWIGEDDDVRSFYQQFEEDAWLVPEKLHDEAASLLGVSADFFDIKF